MRPAAPGKKNKSIVSSSPSSAEVEEMSGVGRCLALPIRKALQGPVISL